MNLSEDYAVSVFWVEEREYQIIAFFENVEIF